MSNPTNASLDKYMDDDILSTLLKYGLYVTAIFQLLLIFSAILISPETDSDADINEETKHGSENLANVRRLYKMRKQEKKKRR